MQAHEMSHPEVLVIDEKISNVKATDQKVTKANIGNFSSGDGK
jgi:hypothetical protein